jgi:hypothetical protein
MVLLFSFRGIACAHHHNFGSISADWPEENSMQYLDQKNLN